MGSQTIQVKWRSGGIVEGSQDWRSWDPRSGGIPNKWRSGGIPGVVGSQTLQVKWRSGGIPNNTSLVEEWWSGEWWSGGIPESQEWWDPKQ